MKKESINVALAGQPNCGKTTMFNLITGSTARVGNYPGITVERLEGKLATENYNINFIDLPGTYSLTSYSMEEIVARNIILEERPDVVVCMLDATALERSLYLVIQLLETGVPVVVGLNMLDELKRKKIEIDSEKLSYLLQIPVVECIARRGTGKENIIREIEKTYEGETQSNSDFQISYGPDLDPAIDKISQIIEGRNFLSSRYPTKWLAVKYLEQDQDVIKKGEQEDKSTSEEIEKIVKEVEEHTEKTLNTYPEALVSDYRYGFIHSILKQDVIKREENFKYDISEKIDRIITQRFFGPIIMIGILYILFYVTFTLGAYPQAWLNHCFEFIGNFAGAYITNENLNSLIVSGIIDGVGAVLSFAPLIFIMFIMLCFLEDLGYMARAAYMLDKIFKSFGLHGASVMPFIISGGIPGGCAVPGVMSARTLRSPKERIATILTAPFMVCGAKATVFLMLADTFFPGHAISVMLILTVSSWIFALIIAKFLRSSIIKGPPTPFIMELPPYRLPTLYGITTHALDRIWHFIKKAGTVIFAFSIVMWALVTYPELPKEQEKAFQKQKEVKVSQYLNSQNKNSVNRKKQLVNSLNKINKKQKSAELQYTVGGRMGTSLESVTKYAGFPWQANIALIGGLVAKEVIISTLATTYSLGLENSEDLLPKEIKSYINKKSSNISTNQKLKNKLSASSKWNLPSVISLLIFILLYSPCLPTIAIMAKETSWYYAIFGTLGSIVFAFSLSFIVYQCAYLFM